MVRGQSTPVLALVVVIDLAEVKLLDHVRYKPRQMILRKPVLQARRHQKGLIERTSSESLAHIATMQATINIVKQKCLIYLRQTHRLSQFRGQVQYALWRSNGCASCTVC